MSVLETVYSLSYIWYITISGAFTVILGFIVSLITGIIVNTQSFIYLFICVVHLVEPNVIIEKIFMMQMKLINSN